MLQIARPIYIGHIVEMHQVATWWLMGIQFKKTVKSKTIQSLKANKYWIDLTHVSKPHCPSLLRKQYCLLIHFIVIRSDIKNCQSVIVSTPLTLWKHLTHAVFDCLFLTFPKLTEVQHHRPSFCRNSSTFQELHHFPNATKVRRQT